MAIDRQVRVIISAVDRYSGGMDSFTLSWKKITKAALAAEAAIFLASAIAAKFAIDMGTNVFIAATDFYDAVFDIEAVASSFGTTTEQISGALDDLVNKFPVTGKEGGEALQLIAQMGYGTEEQLRKVSNEAMTLSIATGTDLKTSAEATMATMNQFGISVDEVGRVTNLFAAVAFTSAASVTDLKEAMKYAGAEAALSGISMEVTAAAIGILRDKGLEASQAGTTFRMALSKLYKETDAGAESLAKYGLTYDDVKPSVVGLTGVIEAFDGKTLDAEDAMNIFGVRSKSMALLVNEGSEAFKEYVERVSDTTASYEAAEIKLGKWSVVMDNVGGSMDIFKKTIAGDIVPVLIEFVGKTENDGIRGVITQLMEMEKVSGDIGQPMISLFESLREVAGELFEDAFEDVEGFYDWLGLISEVLGKNIEILAIWGAAAVEAFVGATDEGDELKFILELVNGAITALMIPVGIIHDLFVGFFYMVQLGWDTVEFMAYEFNAAIADTIIVLLKLVDALPFVDMGDQIKIAAEEAEKWKQMAADAFDTEPPELWTGKVIEASAKATEAISEFGIEGKEVQEKVKEATEESIEKTGLLASEVLALGEDYEYIDGKVVKIKESTEATTREVVYMGEAAKDTKEELSKIEELELEMGITQFKSDLKIAEQAAKDAASLIETQLEWTAKIDIAEIEAAADVAVAEAKVMESAFSSVSESITSISSGLGELTEALTSGELTTSQEWMMEDLLEAQVEMQGKLVDAQVEMLEAETKKMGAETKQMEAGEAEIGVEIIGDTEGWLKGLIQSLFEEITVKAQAEAFSCFGVE